MRFNNKSSVNPAGQIGAEPAPKGQQFTYAVRAPGRLVNPEEFGHVIVRQNLDGSTVRLKDVSRIELGSLIYQQIGRIGVCGVCDSRVLFLVLCHRLIRIAQTTVDPFGMYIAIGIVGMFAFQVFENIGADMYLSPSTGITLPFISYGGTSLVVNYFAVGIVLSVGLRRRRIRLQTNLETSKGRLV